MPSSSLADVPADVWCNVLARFLSLIDVCRLRLVGRAWLALMDRLVVAAAARDRPPPLSLPPPYGAARMSPCAAPRVPLDEPNGIHQLASLMVNPQCLAQLMYELCHWWHRIGGATGWSATCCTTYAQANSAALLFRGGAFYYSTAHGAMTMRTALATLFRGIVVMRESRALSLPRWRQPLRSVVVNTCPTIASSVRTALFVAREQPR